MRFVKLGTIVGAVFLSGCATVSSIEPLGERPKQVLQAEWAATWLHQDHPVVIRVADPQQGQIVIWPPDPDRCAALVKSGAIPGTVEEGGDVILDRLRVVSGEQGGCLSWTEPLVFFRLGR
jgi:hypothetical protein